MSNEKQQQLAGALNFIGQAASILTLPIIAGFWYTINLKIDNTVQAQQIINQQTYVQKPEFNATIDALKVNNHDQWMTIQALQISKQDKEK